MLILNGIMLFLGMIMDMAAIILVATPVLLPIAIKIGVDPAHFGIIMMLNLGIGLITRRLATPCSSAAPSPAFPLKSSPSACCLSLP